MSNKYTTSLSMPRARGDYWVVAGLFVLTLAWGSIFTLNTLPFEGPDEPFHYCYAALIAQNHALPSPVAPAHYERRQPPLYYLLAAPLLADLPVTCYEPPPNPFTVYDQSSPINDNRNVYALTRAERALPDVIGLKRIRLLSVVLGGLTVSFTYLSARLVFPEEKQRAIAAAVLVAALPPFTWISSLANNDSLAACFGSALTYACLRVVTTGSTRRRAIGLGLLAGLALISKLNTALFVPISLAALFVSHARSCGWKTRFGELFLATLGLLAAASWWFIRNGLLSPKLAGPGQLRWLGPIRWATPPSVPALLTHAWQQFTSFWGGYGYQIRMPVPVQVAGAGLFLAALAGILLWLWSRSNRANREAVLWLAVITALDLAGGIYAVLISRDGGQGRFLYPGITSIAILLVLGWSQLWPRRLRRVYPLAVGAITVLFALTSFLLLYRPAYRLPTLFAAGERPAFDSPVHANFEGVAELLGASLAPARVAGDGLVVTRLCWKPLANSRNVTVFAHVVDSRSNRIAGRETLPGLGRYLAADWEIGRPFCDDISLRLPPDADAPARYNVIAGMIGLRPRLEDGTQPGAVVAGSFVIASRPAALPAEMIPANADFGGQTTLLGYTLQTLPWTPGQTGQLTLFWRAETELAESYHVFVHLFDSRGRLVAQSDGLPRDGAYPTDSWAVGEVVMDSYLLAVDPQAARGPARLKAGLYSWPSGTRLEVAGENVADRAVTLEGLVIGP